MPSAYPQRWDPPETGAAALDFGWVGADARGGEAPVMLAEFDDQGHVSPILSREAAEAKWQHHRDPAFVAELARRGVTFDSSQLAKLAGA